MTAKDLKLNKWYVEDNGWNQLFLLYMNDNKWLVYDPDTSGTLSIRDDIEVSDELEEVDNQKLVYYDVIRDVFEENLDVML